MAVARELRHLSHRSTPRSNLGGRLASPPGVPHRRCSWGAGMVGRSRALVGRFPSWQTLHLGDGIEVNDLERGIHVRLSEHSAFVSVAFWEAADGVDPMDLAHEAVRIIEVLTGLVGFDPQTMSPTSDDSGRAATIRQDTAGWISTTLEADEDT
jgi:hypothetical protein